jgi:hypothetical protein
MPDKTGENNQANSSENRLVALLEEIVKLYQEALHLEKNLSEITSSGDVKQLRDNTRAKQALMERIEKADSELSPLIAKYKTNKGVFDNKIAERLRREALDQLGKIEQAERKNLEAIAEGRKKLLDGFRHAKHAKKAVRGYKRSHTPFRSRFDTKS